MRGNFNQILNSETSDEYSHIQDFARFSWQKSKEIKRKMNREEQPQQLHFKCALMLIIPNQNNCIEHKHINFTDTLFFSQKTQ